MSVNQETRDYLDEVFGTDRLKAPTESGLRGRLQETMSPIYVSEGATYELHPDGTYPAVCCDVVDLGFVETQWGKKHQLRLVFQTPLNKEDGTPFLLSETHTASLAENSNLRKRLVGWRGKEFSKEELERFDVETIYRAQCLLQVIHKQGSRGGTFANIAGVMKAARGQEAVTIRDYVREVNRKPSNLYDDNEVDREAEEESPF